MGNTAPGIESRKYLSGIKWKTNIHHKHGTRLISLYYYLRCEGTLIQELHKALSEYGIHYTLLSKQELFEKITTDRAFQRFAMSLSASISLLKTKRIDPHKLISNVDQITERYLGVLNPFYDAYQTYLIEKKAIDFEDMLEEASKAISDGVVHREYDYVIVDEYQDISPSRYRLLSEIRKKHDYKIFCVGDDWQSIFRFSGCDVDYLTHFERYWGPYQVINIENTHRFGNPLLDISSKFIMTNPNQTVKHLHNPDDKETFLRTIFVNKGQKVVEVILKILCEVENGSSILLLGRYNDDKRLIADYATLKETEDGVYSVNFNNINNLDVEFRTVHKAKGLQADYVFVLNCLDDVMGFPSRLKDSPIVPYVYDNGDLYEYAEERRLFYVALTRSKKGTYLVLRFDKISPFVKELSLTE